MRRQGSGAMPQCWAPAPEAWGVRASWLPHREIWKSIFNKGDGINGVNNTQDTSKWDLTLIKSNKSSRLCKALDFISMDLYKIRSNVSIQQQFSHRSKHLISSFYIGILMQSFHSWPSGRRVPYPIITWSMKALILVISFFLSKDDRYFQLLLAEDWTTLLSSGFVEKLNFVNCWELITWEVLWRTMYVVFIAKQ